MGTIGGLNSMNTGVPDKTSKCLFYLYKILVKTKPTLLRSKVASSTIHRTGLFSTTTIIVYFHVDLLARSPSRYLAYLVKYSFFLTKPTFPVQNDQSLA